MNADVMDLGALDRAVTLRQFAAAMVGTLAHALGYRQWWWAREVRAESRVEWRVTTAAPAACPAADAWETLCRTLRRSRSPRRGPVPGASFVSERGIAWLLDGRPGRRSVVVAVADGRAEPADPAREATLGSALRAAYARALALERTKRECALYEALLESSTEAVLLLDWDLKPMTRTAGATARLGRRGSGASLPDAVRQRLYLMRATWERALLAWEKPEDETAWVAGPNGSAVEIRMLAGREPEPACPQFLLRFQPPAARRDRDPIAADWPTVAIRHGIEPILLRLLAEGATTNRMASVIGVSPAAIRARMSRLYRRFGCAGRIGLLRRLAEGSPS